MRDLAPMENETGAIFWQEAFSLFLMNRAKSNLCVTHCVQGHGLLEVVFT